MKKAAKLDPDAVTVQKSLLMIYIAGRASRGGRQAAQGFGAESA